MGRLSETRALVTGSTRGIGEATARLFAREGAQVALCGRRGEVAERIAAEIRSEGGNARAWRCDVSSEPEVVQLLADIDDAFGGLDVVVNNAGIAPASPVEEMALETWNELMTTNVTSMFLVCKHAIPLLRRSSKRPSIINLGSTFGVVGASGSAAYALTKAAAISFSRSLAIELAGDGIRVNALCPGATTTPFLDEWAESTGNHDGAMEWLHDHHPLGRLSTPEEQAAAALFLASTESSFVTGHALLVDGGYTAQ